MGYHPEVCRNNLKDHSAVPFQVPHYGLFYKNIAHVFRLYIFESLFVFIHILVSLFKDFVNGRAFVSEGIPC